jgi:carbonic anhydrase
MRLFETILDANHRAVAGDASAGLRPADFADELPIVALTCVDPRLNAFFPNVLALPAEDFIWLRNAGNLITSAMSSTMRSLALACAVKGGREIAIIGHTDCRVCKTTTTQLLEKLQALGVNRSHLPDNVNEFFGTFGSERQNVIKACDYTRKSPLIGPKIPVHGLMLDVETGRLEWVVNGYETLAFTASPAMSGAPNPPKFGDLGESLGAFKDFAMGEMKFPANKIGELAAHVENAFSTQIGNLDIRIGQLTPAGAAAPPELPAAETSDPALPKAPLLHIQGSPPPPIKKAPLPPPIRPHNNFRRS